MGIKGLTTYIARNSELFLEEYELHDCTLVIDGCSLAAQLYNSNTKRNDSFGGDYDKFRHTVTNFFDALKKCNVNPIVILDGGFEYKKLRTLNSRFLNKVENCKKLNPTTQCALQVFPLLQMDVFRDIMLDLELKCVQCDFEADYEIATVARFLNIPVLACDSDFYVYDVLYIPIPTLEIQVRKNDDRINVMKCKLYRIEKFLKRFGGMDKNMLPLMSTLLGNDYVQKSTFRNFFAQLKLPSKQKKNSSEQQRSIAALVNWLKYETFESAQQKVLNRVKMNQRRFISNVIQQSVKGYKTESKEILKILELDTDDNKMEIDNDITNMETEDYKIIDSSDRFRKVYYVPNEFITNYHKSIYPPTFINLITKHMCILTMQQEDLNLGCSHEISFNLIGILFSLLTDQNYTNFSLKYHCNNELVTERQKLSKNQNLPKLKELFSLDLNQNRKLFFEFVNFSNNDIKLLTLFPDKWQLFVVCIVYWARNVKDLTIKPAHLSALILSLLYMNVLDEKIGYHRSEKVFLNKYENKLKKIKESQTVEEISCTTNCKDIKNFNVCSNDCLLAIEVLLSHFNINEKMLTQVKLYNRQTVHLYAEFQSTARYISYINSLLGFPLERNSISNMYNGTFIYNTFEKLKSRNSVHSYVELILKSTSSFLHLYKHVVDSFQQFLPDINYVD